MVLPLHRSFPYPSLSASAKFTSQLYDSVTANIRACYSLRHRTCIKLFNNEDLVFWIFSSPIGVSFRCLRIESSLPVLRDDGLRTRQHSCSTSVLSRLRVGHRRATRTNTMLIDLRKLSFWVTGGKRRGTVADREILFRGLDIVNWSLETICRSSLRVLLWPCPTIIASLSRFESHSKF
ncbi:hypothetical protein Trydic_g14387 [Trypoxylus dichotomus]